MKRFGTLPAVLAAAALGLAACTDQPTSAPALSAGPSLNESAAEGGTFLVDFSGGIPAGFQASVASLGGTVVFAHQGVGLAAVSGLSDAAAQTLRGQSGVRDVIADVVLEMDPVTPSDAEVASAVESPANPAAAFFFARQWHMRVIGAHTAWAAGRVGSPAVKVGVLDTGIGYTHADLAGRVDLALSRSFLPAEDARVQALFPGAHNVADLHYHGTHTASTIASNGLAAAGVTSGVTLVGLKVCGAGVAPSWRGSCPSSAVLPAILYAADQGLDVINMSLGGRFNRRDAAGGGGPSFIATVAKVMNYAHRKGTTVVVSAGNDNVDLDHDGNGYKTYCSAPTVICVSATGPTAQAGTNGPWTNIDAKASYSNYGRSSVNVAGPGGNGASSVWAACSTFSLAVPVCRTGTFVVGIQGTSMAAPHVAGTAALLVEDLGRSPAQIRARIQQSADDLGEVGTDPIYGKGRLNVARALGL